jgi:hypothetical protein
MAGGGGGFPGRGALMSVLGRLALILLGSAVLLAAGPLRAQDLDTGKSAQRLFAANCATCHRTPRGLAKQNQMFLASFLREHYTSSRESANELAAYLAANSAPPATKQRSKAAVGTAARGATAPTAAVPTATAPAVAASPAAAGTASSPTKRKSSKAAPPPQPSRSLWDLLSGSDPKPPAPTKRKKTKREQSATAPRPATDLPSR